jgi:hypothetical protein
MFVQVDRTNRLTAALVVLSISLSVPASLAQVATPESLLKKGTGTSPGALLSGVIGQKQGASPLFQQAAKLEETPQSDSPSSQDILSAVPAEASVVLIIRDLAGLDAKLRGLTEQLGLPFSPYMLAKGWLEVVMGIDDHGPAAIALVPGVPVDAGESGSAHGGAGLGHATRPGMVMLLPTGNRDELLSFLNPRVLDDGYTRVTLRGHESWVAAKGRFTVFASDLHAAKAVLHAKNSLADRFSEYQRKRAALNDVSLWIDLSSTGASVLQGIGIPWAGGAGHASVRARLGSALFRGVQLSARVEPEGLALDLYAERYAAHRGTPAQETTDTMLLGLPDEAFVLAMGMTGGAVTANAHAIVDLFVSGLSAAGILEPARLGELTLALERAMDDVESAASSVSILPEGSDGMIASAKVVQTAGDGRMLTKEIESIVRVWKRGVFVNPDVNSVLEKLEYRRGVETSSGVTIDHLVLDLSGYEAVDKAAISRLFGEEGLLERIGVVDDHYVVQSIGGGLDRFNQIVAAVRAGRAPLASDPGAMRSALGVARKRSMEAYLSVDRGMRLANLLSAVVGPSAKQLDIPETNAPVALAMHSVGPSATQVDVFVPTALMVAVKNAMLEQAANEVTLGP